MHTTTVDAGGADEQGVTRVLGGNPQTGPFYVENAMPGDVLAVRFDRIRLNRDYAVPTMPIVGRAMGPQFAVKMKDVGKTVRWHLDGEKGVATSESPGEHLAGLHGSAAADARLRGGCAGFGAAPFPTGDSGRFGGNMDFNEIVEGVTVYLPVSQPGALLYVGDGHAAQGDGELNGNALETSMEVEFTVDVVQSKSIMAPRIESATGLMAIGLGGLTRGRVAAVGRVDRAMARAGLRPHTVGDRAGPRDLAAIADRRGGGSKRRGDGHAGKGCAATSRRGCRSVEDAGTLTTTLVDTRRRARSNVV